MMGVFGITIYFKVLDYIQCNKIQFIERRNISSATKAQSPPTLFGRKDENVIVGYAL